MMFSKDRMSDFENLKMEDVMLFHLEYSHTAETCFKNKKEIGEMFFGRLRIAEEFGVTIKNLVGNSMEHRIFMLVEAKTAEGLHEWLDPIVDLGHIKVTSVVEKSL